MNGNRQDNHVIYVKDLPPSVHFQLNSLLNLQDKWQDLAGVLGHWDMLALEQFRMAGWRDHGSGGPTRLLILDWQRLLPKVTELYAALYQISMLHACHLLRDYVPEEMVHTLDNHRHQGAMQPGALRQGHTPQGALYQGQPSQGGMHQGSCFPGNMHQGPMYQRSMPQSPMYPGSMHQGPVERGAMHGDIPMPAPPPTTSSPAHPSQGHIRSQQGYTQGQSYNLSEGHNYRGSTSPVKSTGNKVFGEIEGFSLTTGMSKSSALSTSMSKMESLGSGQNKGESLNSSWRPTPANRQSLNKSTSSINPGDGLRKSTAMISALTFPYHQIKEATNNFHKQNVIGEGGFGIVYRAELRRTLVAVKVLKDFERPEDDQDCIESHLTELSSLFTYRHVNIIRLIGYSILGPKTCLVYEHMANGSLEDRIQCKGGTAALGWEHRLMIMMGAASGLQYLHTAQDKPLIHGDIKSANILLDQTMQAKLSDFGQARQATGCTKTDNFTHVTGNMKTCPIYATRAYLPRDFFNDCRLSISTDTYSFGVVLFEVCTGQKALDYKRGPDGDEFLRDYIRSTNETLGLDGLVRELDPLVPEWPLDIYKAMMQIGLNCTEKRKKTRPDMLMVHSSLQRLEGERRIIEFNGLQRLPPQGASDNSDSSGFPTGPAGPYSPPHSHRIDYVSGEHPMGKVLEPPSSLGMSVSFSSCPSQGNQPDGKSDPSSADDPRFSACDRSKLTDSEKILEARNAPLREADIAARMRKLTIVQTGSRAGGEQSYIAPESLPGPGSCTGKVESVPYNLQQRYDELAEERRKLDSFNARVGLGRVNDVRTDLFGQRDNPSSAGPDTQAVGSASHCTSDITLDVTGHMALLDSKKKKSFPFASKLNVEDCDEGIDNQQGAAVDGPVTGASHQARDTSTEGGIPGEGLHEGVNQSDGQRATENEVTPSPTSSFYQQHQPLQQPSPRQNQFHTGPYTAVQPQQAPHYTPGNYQMTAPMTNAPHNETNAGIHSARFPCMANARYSLEPPDSEEIHSSDLYCDSDGVEPNGGRMGFFTRTHTEGKASMSSIEGEDQRRIARSLELQERGRQLNHMEPKETRDFDEH